MSLVTRCPTCGTAFRVHSAQLAMRGGRVRCGKCAAVFDGVSALMEEGAVPPAADPEPSPQLALFDPNPYADAAAPTGGAASAPEPGFLREAPAPRGRLAWAMGALAAFVALAFQVLLHYRTEVAVLFPEARAPLAAACAALGCTLHLPRRPDLMSIESSDLESDNRGERLIVLHAVIHNRAPFAQDYPALELTLTDERDQPVLRRVLAPADYLRATKGATGTEGIAPGAETALRLHFDTGGLRAVGYRLYLFYP